MTHQDRNVCALCAILLVGPFVRAEPPASDFLPELARQTERIAAMFALVNEATNDPPPPTPFDAALRDLRARAFPAVEGADAARADLAQLHWRLRFAERLAIAYELSVHGSPADPIDEPYVDTIALERPEELPAAYRASRAAFVAYGRSTAPRLLERARTLDGVVLEPRPMPIGDDARRIGLSELRSIAHFERGRMLIAIPRGDAAVAADAFDAQLALAATARGDLTIGWLVSESIATPAVEALRRAAAAGRLSPACCRACIDILERRRPEHADFDLLVEAMRLETHASMHRVRTDPRYVGLMSFGSDHDDEALLASIDDVERTAREIDALHAAFGVFISRDRHDRSIDELFAALPADALLLREQPSVLLQLAKTRDAAQCVVAGLRILLAIEIYRHAHGAAPVSLDDLVPEVLAELPRDPFAPDGRFRYRRLAEHHELPIRGGYQLYSVGMDGRDDGGIEAVLCEAWKPEAWAWASESARALRTEDGRVDYVVNLDATR